MTALQLPHPSLSDGVVSLREWTPGDVPHRLMAAFGDPLVQRFSWPLSRPYTEADAQDYLRGQAQEREAGVSLAFAIVPASGPSESVLGGGSLYDIDLVERRAAVGYWLAAGARGYGYATRAVRLAAGFAFETLGVERLELTCAPENAASQAVAGRAGFRREALLRSHMTFKGGRRDTVVFSRLVGDAA